MSQNLEHTGFAIAVSWPETYCKQPGDWYDGLAKAIGISKHHYYKVGHTAIVLVQSATKQCHYFDFGRYHAPFQHGRVRSQFTDDGLRIRTLANISFDGVHIGNIKEILTELQKNHESHGEGILHASYVAIDFESAYQKALEMQNVSPIPYGPFRYKGSNCSRFVNKVILAGKPAVSLALRLKFLLPFTPTPMSNVKALKHQVIIPKILKMKSFCPMPIEDKGKLTRTLDVPEKNVKIPNGAHWLSGEGAGSWFHFIGEGHGQYTIVRYGSVGDVECEGRFDIEGGKAFDINAPFSIDYLSHCQRIIVRQGAGVLVFVRNY